MTKKSLIGAVSAVTVVLLAVGYWLVKPINITDDNLANLVSNLETGQQLIRVAGCYGCHTANEGQPLAGGKPLETPFGVFYAPNITGSPEGIGNWSLTAFEEAIRHGVAPSGDSYYPVFPYVSYRSLTNQDVVNLFAALQATKPSSNQAPEHQLAFPYSWRAMMKPWRLLFLPSQGIPIDQSTPEGRGRYLIDAVAHCGECHTPRNGMGAPVPPYLGGADLLPSGEFAPPIHGRALSRNDWTEEDLAYFMGDGFLPDGDSVGGRMVDIIEDGTQFLSDDDQAAMARYLMSLQ